jgi:hypothetical protein
MIEIDVDIIFVPTSECSKASLKVAVYPLKIIYFKCISGLQFAFEHTCVGVHRHLQTTQVDTTIDKADAVFLQQFLPLFVAGPTVSMRELYFRNADHLCVTGSLDVVVGKPSNGGRPIVKVNNCGSLKSVHLASVCEAKPIDDRLSPAISGFSREENRRVHESIWATY